LDCFREEYDQAHALSASLANVQRQGHISVIDPFLAHHSALVASNSSNVSELSIPAQYQSRSEDFPTLDNNVSSMKGPSSKKKQPMESDRKDSAADNQQSLEQSLSDTLAKKLAMSNRQSVRSGPMTDTDFPSLPSSKEDQKTHTNSWVQCSSKGKKKTVKTAWNTQGDSSAWHSNEVVEEFPQLHASNCPTMNSRGSENNLVFSLSDISRSFSSGNLELMSGRPNSAMSDSYSWGPELNKAAKNKQNESKEHDGFLRMSAKQKAKKQSADKSSTRDSTSVFEGKAVKKLSDLSLMLGTSAKADKINENERDTKEKVAEKYQSKDKKAADKNVSKQSTKNCTAESVNSNSEFGQSSSKSEDSEHMTYGKFSVLSSYPEKAEKQEETAKLSLSKETVKPSLSKVEAERQGTKREKKNGRKLKVENNATKKTNVCGDTPAVVFEQSSSVAVDSCIAVEIPLKDDSSNSVLGTDKVDGTEAIVFTADDFPSLVVPKMKSLSSSKLSGDNKAVTSARSTLTTLENIAVKKTPVDCSGFLDVDFPNLSSFIPTNSVVTAPPGFSAPSKPPPGFGNSAPASCKLPPGFSAFPIESNSFSTLTTREADTCSDISAIASVSSKEMEYIAPRDAKERGVRLFEKIAVTLGSENVSSFRELSADFRQGRVSASDYHDKCLKIFGHDKFNAVFPELVALLPDVPKQRQLLKIHRELVSSMKASVKSSSAWSSAVCDSLTLCVLCGQVLLLDDRRDHENAHNLDSEYPVLWGAIPCTVR